MMPSTTKNNETVPKSDASDFGVKKTPFDRVVPGIECVNTFIPSSIDAERTADLLYRHFRVLW